MIEYTLISSILNKICEMIKTPLQYPRNTTLLDPLKQLLEIKTWWGLEWKMQIDKTNEWVAWRWVTKKVLHCSNKL
jgi:hypothetical protein